MAPSAGRDPERTASSREGDGGRTVVGDGFGHSLRRLAVPLLVL